MERHSYVYLRVARNTLKRFKVAVLGSVPSQAVRSQSGHSQVTVRSQSGHSQVMYFTIFSSECAPDKEFFLLYTHMLVGIGRLQKSSINYMT